MKEEEKKISKFILKKKKKGIIELSTMEIIEGTKIPGHIVSEILDKFEREGRIKAINLTLKNHKVKNMNLLFFIRFLAKLPFFLMVQLVFLAVSPIFLMVTLFPCPDLTSSLLGIKPHDIPAPTTIKEWFKDWTEITFSPYYLFYR